MSHKYDDIIHLPHPVSSRRPRMSRLDRAAQFSPFAALRGYEAAVQEAGRLTHEKIILGEDEVATLNESLQWIEAHIEEHPTVFVEYFLPDAVKDGGAYMGFSGEVKCIDEYQRNLVFMDGTRIPVDDVWRLKVEK